MRGNNILLAAGAGICVLLGACASTGSVPELAVSDAALTLAKAEEARAGEFAPQQLQNARDKLRVAREESAKGGRDSQLTARRLAEQAKADAEVALSAAESARASIASAEVSRSIDMLVQNQRR